MTTLVIFLLLAQQLTGKPLIAGVVEGGERDSEQKYGGGPLPLPLTAQQEADINNQIEILTHQETFLGSQVRIIIHLLKLLNYQQITYIEFYRNQKPCLDPAGKEDYVRFTETFFTAIYQ